MNFRTRRAAASARPPAVAPVLALFTGLALLGVAEDAVAQKKSRVITISEVTIVGRIQKPIAAVDVSRIQPKLTLAELKQPFLGRIEKAISKDPF